MVKIWYYLFSNIKKELNYSIRKKTENKLKILLKKYGFFNDNKEDKINNNNFFNNSNKKLLEILLYKI